MIWLVVAWLGFHDTPDFAARFAKITAGMKVDAVRASLGAPTRVQTNLEADTLLSKTDGVLLRDELRFDEDDRLQSVNAVLAPDGSAHTYDWPRLRDVKYRDALTTRYHTLDALRGRSLADVSATLSGRTLRTTQMWLYVEDRAPRVGETLRVYEIAIADGKVQRATSSIGADATGPPPSRAR